MDNTLKIPPTNGQIPGGNPTGTVQQLGDQRNNKQLNPIQPTPAEKGKLETNGVDVQISQEALARAQQTQNRPGTEFQVTAEVKTNQQPTNVTPTTNTKPPEGTTNPPQNNPQPVPNHQVEVARQAYIGTPGGTAESPLTRNLQA